MIREEILRTNIDQWDAIATRHVSLMLEPDVQRVQELAKGWAMLDASQLKSFENSAFFRVARWVSTFGEQFLEPSTCSVCGREAMKRCSRCSVEWYCSRYVIMTLSVIQEKSNRTSVTRILLHDIVPECNAFLACNGAS